MEVSSYYHVDKHAELLRLLDLALINCRDALVKHTDSYRAVKKELDDFNSLPFYAKLFVMFPPDAGSAWDIRYRTEKVLFRFEEIKIVAQTQLAIHLNETDTAHLFYYGSVK